MERNVITFLGCHESRILELERKLLNSVVEVKFQICVVEMNMNCEYVLPVTSGNCHLFIMKGNDDSNGVKSILEMNPMFPLSDSFVTLTLNTL